MTAFVAGILIPVFAGIAFAQVPPVTDETPGAIQQLNRNLAVVAGAPVVDVGKLADLLQKRAALVKTRILTDPSDFPAWALSQELSAKLFRFVPNAPIETEGVWEGGVEAWVEDDFEHAKSRKLSFLRTARGRFLLSSGQSQVPGAGRLAVTGVRLGEIIGVLGATRPDAVPQTPVSPGYNNPLGVQHVAVFMVTTPSNPAFPAGMDAAFFQHEFFSRNSGGGLATASLNDFISESSYGKASVTGNVFGPIALTQDFSCDNLGELLDVGNNLPGQSSIDLTQFNHAVYVFPASTCSFAGLGTIGSFAGPGYSFPTNPLQYSYAYIPIFPNYTPQTSGLAGVIAHEFGHNLGLEHSSSDDYGALALGTPGSSGALVDYGDPFSVMGSSAEVYEGAGDTASFGQYTAYQKAFILNWLGPSDFLEIKSGGSAYLQPFESSSGARALRILRDPKSQTWLWLEYRQPIGVVDSSFSAAANSGQTNIFSGALVHYEDPALNDLSDTPHSYLLTMNPVAAPNSFQYAALAPGVNWHDPYSLLNLSVSSPTSDGLTVTVAYDQPCAALNVSQTSFQAAGGSGTITVTAPATCSWNVSTSGAPITVSSALSGTGNGTVAFSVAPNSSTLPIIGYITVQRQTTEISQAGMSLSVGSVSPGSGSGTAATFAFQFSDAQGVNDISSVRIAFFGDPGCTFSGGPGSPYVFLNDFGGQFWGDLNFNGFDVTQPGMTASNGACSISSSGASTSASGNQFQFTIPVTFLAGSGTYRVMALVYTKTGAPIPPWMLLGSWSPNATPVVPPAAGPVLTSPANGASAVGVSTPLTWKAASGAASYDVYLGTSQSLLFAGNVSGTNYSPAALNPGTTYYWQVVAKGVAGANGSAVWSFTTLPPQPAINPNGIVPLFSSTPTIQPGSWVSIYGTNLAGATSLWAGDFPTSLGGTSVSINNKPAYLWLVSPSQINLQAPDDTTTGPVSVIVTTPAGAARSTVILAPQAPSFSLLGDDKHVAGIIARSDGSGAYGGGTYDILGPTGTSLGYSTLAAKAGDNLALFGVGFGASNPAVPAGQAYSGASPTAGAVTVTIGGVQAEVSFSGITEAGLYQINIAVPDTSSGDQPVVATINGVQTPQGPVIAVQ